MSTYTSILAGSLSRCILFNLNDKSHNSGTHTHYVCINKDKIIKTQTYNKSERDLHWNNRSQIKARLNSRFNEIYPLFYSMEE